MGVFNLTFKQILVIILGIIELIVGGICIYSYLQMSVSLQGSTEMKFWFFISFTSLIIFFFFIPVTFILLDKVFATKTIKESKIKEKWKKIDYLAAFFLIGGLVIEVTTAISLGYLTIFVPFKELKTIIIFNLSFTAIVQILIYIGLGMQLIAILLVVAFVFEKDDKLRLKRKEKTIRE